METGSRKPADRLKLPPHYCLHNDGVSIGAWHANIHGGREDWSGFITQEEALKACWTHRGLIRQDAGVCPWHDEHEFGCEPCAELQNKQTARDREQQAMGIELAADEFFRVIGHCQSHDDSDAIKKWLHELAAKVRRGE